MEIYLAMVSVDDWAENGGGVYALDKAFYSYDAALAYAQAAAKEWDEDDEEEGRNEGFVKVIILE